MSHHLLVGVGQLSSYGSMSGSGRVYEWRRGVIPPVHTPPRSHTETNISVTLELRC